jgi:hypothetical protein
MKIVEKLTKQTYFMGAAILKSRDAISGLVSSRFASRVSSRASAPKILDFAPKY